jgi:hypothetical protein
MISCLLQNKGVGRVSRRDAEKSKDEELEVTRGKNKAVSHGDAELRNQKLKKRCVIIRTGIQGI